jgi:UrcA family protein
MTTKTAFTALTAVLALGFAAAGQSASAQSTETASVEVSYAGLDLSTPAGAKVFLQRIRNAADSICGSETLASLAQHRVHALCVTKITDKTVASFNNPIVTALNSGNPTPSSMVQASAR